MQYFNTIHVNMARYLILDVPAYVQQIILGSTSPMLESIFSVVR